VQVLAARESGNVKTLVTDLDVLANFPSVESVVASTAVRANRDLSQIRELLILTGTPLPDAATLRHLKGLHTLYTLLASGTERLDLGSLEAEQMRELALSRWWTKNLVPLERMTRLRQLHVDLFHDPVDPVSKMTGLEYLHVLGPATGWAKLRECTLLKEAHLIHVQITNLRRWNTWQQLRVLRLGGRGIRSLAGLEKCQQLEELTLLNLNMTDLAPLRELPHLKKLTLRMVAKGLDLLSVAAIPRLQSLIIDDAAESDILHLPSVKPLVGLSGLEELALLQTTVADGDLMPLAELPKLCKVRLGSMIGADAEKLRAARPDMDIDYTPPNPKLQALGEQIGSVTIQKPGVYAKTESDIRSVAEVINDLLNTFMQKHHSIPAS
jgi:hypothetical protein